MHWNSGKCLYGGLSRNSLNTDKSKYIQDKLTLLTQYIFFKNVGFVVYALDECAASIFIVDDKESGRIMIENFEDRSISNFRVAGYTN